MEAGRQEAFASLQKVWSEPWCADPENGPSTESRMLGNNGGSKGGV